MMRGRDHTAEGSLERAQLDGIVARLTTLEEVLRWAAGPGQPASLVEVVTQDEYTHDVVLRWVNGLFLVFDST